MKQLGPGARIGVLGGGQLGRMLTLAASRLGYAVHVLDPDPDAPAARLAERCVRAELDDCDAVSRLAAAVDVVTFEFENVPLAAVAVAARHAPVHPGPAVLGIAQHRLSEKRFLTALGLPLARWAPVASEREIGPARARIPGEAILKRCSAGYDGKGQRSLAAGEPLEEAWRALGACESVLEQRVALASECSVLIVRSAAGDVETFGPIANVHAGGILDHSRWPARLSPGLAQRAREASRVVAEALDCVGVLCVEWFVTEAGELLVNEIAPRPHNSGHLTIEACASSQFEQQVRAICGMPLGCFAGARPAAMANLLGDLWRCGEPDWQGALRLPRVALHLYGKRTPRPGRKMGHLTTLAANAEQAGQRVLAAREALGGAAPGASAAAALASARRRSGEPHAGLFAG